MQPWNGVRAMHQPSRQPARPARLRRLFGVAALSALALTGGLRAQVKLPKPPDKFAVSFRIQIAAETQDRVRQFADLQKRLDRLGFVLTESEDSDLIDTDPTLDRLDGTVPPAGLAGLAALPEVQTVLAQSSAAKPPAAPDARLPIRVALRGAQTPTAQLVLWRQASEALSRLGFIPAIGYDDRAGRDLIGTFPAARLNELLKDLRRLPDGWFAPEVPSSRLPSPLSEGNPVELVEVLPAGGEDVPTVSFALPPAVAPEDSHLRKLEPELFALSGDMAKGAEPARVEVIFDATTDFKGRGWRSLLLGQNPAYQVEGLVGPLATLTLPAASQIRELARLPNVLHVRRPRLAAPLSPVIAQASGPAIGDPMRVTGLDRLHAVRKTGQGVRVVLIDTDFRGLDALVGKTLRPDTTLIDLTAELTRDLRPTPRPAGGGIGHGTHLALTVAAAAPNARLTLVRVDPSAAHQVQTVARGTVLDPRGSEALALREDEVAFLERELSLERPRVEAQLRAAQENFDADEAGDKFRADAKAAFEAFQVKAADLSARRDRLEALKASLSDLAGVHLVCNPLTWESGHPYDGLSPLAQSLNETLGKSRPLFVSSNGIRPKPPLWVQAGGDLGGSGWADWFQDADRNGVMDFAPPTVTARPRDRWSHELNFLARLGSDGKPTFDLPAGGKVRVTLQWREPVDPTLPDPADELYRTPLADLRLFLLHQRDPEARSVRSDDLRPAAVTLAPAVRLLKMAEATVYEQRAELSLPVAGRYAVRVEGRVPDAIRPPGTFALGAPPRWELRPKLLVEALDGTGPVVFADFPAARGGVGTPGDSLTPATIGAVGPDGIPRRLTSLGSGPGTALLIKPDVVAFDAPPGVTGPARGTPVAAAFATGMAASLMSAGVPRGWFFEAIGHSPGAAFRIPEAWLQPK